MKLLSLNKAARRPALAGLLDRYLNGQITERTWKQIMRLLDRSDITEPERKALAAFLIDAIDEFGPHVKLPRLKEAKALLADLRAAA